MRRLRATVALAVLLSAGACVWLALDRPVRVVKVEGELAKAEAAQIRRRIGQVLEARLLTMDVATLRQRVKDLSWPGEVSIRKVWPDTIVVRVERRTVVATWSDAGYVTSSGDIVSSPNAPADVPVFECAISSPGEAMEIYRYLQAMAVEAGLRITGISENEIGEWQLTMSGPAIPSRDGSVVAAPPSALPAPDTWPMDATRGALPEMRSRPVVMLGADRLRERMQRFLAAWPRLSARPGAVDYVDLRYRHGIAVRWSDAGTEYATAMGAT